MYRMTPEQTKRRGHQLHDQRIIAEASHRRATASERPCSREQQVFLIAEYTKLAQDKDPRAADLLHGIPFEPDREGRIAWAAHHLGAPNLTSFNDLTQRQAEYLCDLLATGRTKLDRAVVKEWDRLRVHDPESYFGAMQLKSSKFKFGGRSLCQLNRWQKWTLLSELKTRRPSLVP